jgi:hypothetical protein
VDKRQHVGAVTNKTVNAMLDQLGDAAAWEPDDGPTSRLSLHYDVRRRVSEQRWHNDESRLSQKMRHVFDHAQKFDAI